MAGPQAKRHFHLSVDARMKTYNQRKSDNSDRPSISSEWLRQQMSEVISLREKVAQAELAANRYFRTSQEHDDGEPSK